MMIEILIYILKVTVLTTTFYMFYRLLMARETFHRMNRIVLLSTAVASFVLPLCVITFHEQVEFLQPAISVVESPSTLDISPSTLHLPPSANEPSTKDPLWPSLLMGIYLCGVLFFLLRMVVSMLRIRHIIKGGELHPQDGYSIVVVDDERLSPFSWWQTVVMSRNDYEHDSPALLAHELGHIRLHHSFDMVFCDTLCALQWFNPAMWMLRQDLRTVHEYEADQQVIGSGFNTTEYLHLLVRKVANQHGYSLANGINNSTLKQRINMIISRPSRSYRLLRLAYVLPIIAVSLYASARTQTDYVYTDASKKDVPPAIQVMTDEQGEEYCNIELSPGAVWLWETADGKPLGRKRVHEKMSEKPRIDAGMRLFINGIEVHKDRIPYIAYGDISEYRFCRADDGKTNLFYITTGRPAYDVADSLWIEVNGHARSMLTGEPIAGVEISTLEMPNEKVVTAPNGNYPALRIRAGNTLVARYNGREVYRQKVKGVNEYGYSPTYYIDVNGEGTNHVYRENEVDAMPEYQGDWAALQKAMDSELSESEAVRSMGRSIPVMLWYVVDESGKPIHIRVMRGVSAAIDAEALRIAQSRLGSFKPATLNGHPVKIIQPLVIHPINSNKTE